MVGEKYYLVYSSVVMHELCYAVSEKPDEGFVYGGVIVSNCDLHIDSYKPADRPMAYGANNHGSIIEIGGAWYIFTTVTQTAHGTAVRAALKNRTAAGWNDCSGRDDLLRLEWRTARGERRVRGIHCLQSVHGHAVNVCGGRPLPENYAGWTRR